MYRIFVIGLLLVTGCSGPQHILEPNSSAAGRISDLWWVMFGLAGAVVVLVATLLFHAIHRSRRRVEGFDTPEVDGRLLVWIGGAIVPALIILSLLAFSYRVGTAVYPPLSFDGEPLDVEVTGHQFWWEVHYPQYGVTTANEIRIPVGRQVRFILRSPDVIHSFWIPRLQGKIDMVPGRVHTLWVEADEPGEFRGQCAEYCGMAHALMAFWVAALTPEEFSGWLERRSMSIPEPEDAEIASGREVFFDAGCVQCHATRGAPLPAALGTVGPDLSDLAGRRTIGAGTLPNTREALRSWITDPEAIKPGSRMPPTDLPDEELEALVRYLQSLQ